VIRINLMPLEERGQKVRRVKKSKAGGGGGGGGRNPMGLLLPIAIIAGVLVAIIGTIVQQQAQIHMLAGEVARVEKESRALAPQIAMVERLSRERADLDLRLSLIDQLSRGRFDSVRLVDELDRAVPDHMWLQSAIGSGEQITLEGTTFSNLIIADLMIRLDRSPLFSNVALANANRGVIDDHDVVSFKLTMNLTPAEMAQGDR
jgi:Tfp pilus assembly protein PilN